MYITVEEIKQGIYAEVLNVITRNTDNVVQAIKEAEAEVASYLSARYDIYTELKKTGTSRCTMVIKIVRDIAIYNCYNISNPVNMPESRRDTYKDTIKFLQLVQAERASINELERLNGGNSNYVAFGGNTKRNNTWE
jgi:phage gp36-like protein